MAGAKVGDIRGFWIGMNVVIGKIVSRSNGITIFEKPRVLGRDNMDNYGTIQLIDKDAKSIEISSSIPMIELGDKVIETYKHDTRESNIIVPKFRPPEDIIK